MFINMASEGRIVNKLLHADSSLETNQDNSAGTKF